MPTIKLGNDRLAYRVTRGQSGRYTYFRFAPDLTLVVVLPRRGRQDVESAIRRKAPWILKEKERVAGSHQVLTSDSVMFKGLRLRIRFDPSLSDRLLPDLDARVVAVGSASRAGIKELVRRWFLKETSSYVVSRTREFARVMQVAPRRVDVREMKKWGYCTREGRLSFSWQLAAISDELKDYVIVHELAHLAVFDHSRSFRAKVASVLPDFRRLEADLDRVFPYDKTDLDRVFPYDKTDL